MRMLIVLAESNTSVPVYSEAKAKAIAKSRLKGRRGWVGCE